MHGFFASVVCGTTFLFLIVSLLHFITIRAWYQIALYGALTSWAVVVHLPLLVMMVLGSMRCAFSSEPIMLTVACNQLRLPRLMQPFAVIWWVAHLVLSFLFCQQVSPLFIDGRKLPADALIVAVLSGAIIVSLLCGLAFGFALLAYAVVDKDRKRLERLNRWSWLWGIGCGVVFGWIELGMR
jgi:hypothetical protein